MPWHKPRVADSANGDNVILLHGLWRSLWAMDPMARYLNSEGYRTINIPYPSFRKDISALMEQVLQEIEQHTDPAQPIHFVTHSLGGILTRHLLSSIPNDRLGCLVMLAPPNRGSEIVDWLENHPALLALLGPSGKRLARKQLNIPPLDSHLASAVIMGDRHPIPFFQKLLDEKNDGIVSVRDGRLDGLTCFEVVHSDHTMIASDPNVMQMTLNFLRSGQTSP